MTETQFAMISEWMANGNINDFVKTHPDADRLGLVCFPFEVPPSSPGVCGRLNNFTSWETSLGG